MRLLSFVSVLSCLTLAAFGCDEGGVWKPGRGRKLQQV